jgi:hypothetical protein
MSHYAAIRKAIESLGGIEKLPQRIKIEPYYDYFSDRAVPKEPENVSNPEKL